MKTSRYLVPTAASLGIGRCIEPSEISPATSKAPRGPVSGGSLFFLSVTTRSAGLRHATGVNPSGERKAVQMITSNVLQRTFFIRVGEATGTAFTLDVDKRQYLVTARHVCPTRAGKTSIDIYHDGAWKAVEVTVVGLGEANKIESDVAVLAPEHQLSLSHPLEPSTRDLVWGQDVFFVGFPFGLHTISPVNNGYPIPIIKGAVMSGVIKGEGGKEVFLLDGHNNPGFSGGPVVFTKLGAPNAEFRVMGVVSGYRTQQVDVTLSGKATGLVSATNTGIVLCPSIARTKDLIRANAIGAPVKW